RGGWLSRVSSVHYRTFVLVLQRGGRLGFGWGSQVGDGGGGVGFAYGEGGVGEPEPGAAGAACGAVGDGDGGLAGLQVPVAFADAVPLGVVEAEHGFAVGPGAEHEEGGSVLAESGGEATDAAVGGAL